jgi:ribosomal-protein-alanine N-acetyltransferase
MIENISVRLATLDDAAGIAAMSREYIEHGLPWSWTEARVELAIRNPDTNVAVVGERGAIAAFGIMSYRDDAHLLLFAVRRQYQRKGVGSALLRWLEEVARCAGMRHIRVECRRSNDAARNFYSEHGYHECAISPRMYRGLEDGILLEKFLGEEA